MDLSATPLIREHALTTSEVMIVTVMQATKFEMKQLVARISTSALVLIRVMRMLNASMSYTPSTLTDTNAIVKRVIKETEPIALMLTSARLVIMIVL